VTPVGVRGKRGQRPHLQKKCRHGNSGKIMRIKYEPFSGVWKIKAREMNGISNAWKTLGRSLHWVQISPPNTGFPAIGGGLSVK